MTFHEICSVLNQLADMGVLFLCLTGGEPLLRNDFWKILEYARKKEFVIRLNSNGALITSEAAKRLVGISFVDISIYGMSENAYKSFTGVKGIFRKVMNAIEQMKKEGVNFTLKAIGLRENLSQIRAFTEMAKKLKVRYRITPKIMSCLDGNKEPLKHGLNSQQLKEFFMQNKRYFLPSVPSNRLLCSADSIFINSEGQVSPCIPLFSTKYKKLNIRNMAISEIYNKNQLFQLLKKLSWKNLPDCMRCGAFRYCLVCAADFIHGYRFSPIPPKEKCKMAWLRKEVCENYKYK
jgi:radical SAM protein with 4Fe4S-binding SPASM domain